MYEHLHVGENPIGLNQIRDTNFLDCHQGIKFVTLSTCHLPVSTATFQRPRWRMQINFANFIDPRQSNYFTVALL